MYFDHTATRLMRREDIDYYCELLYSYNYNPASAYAVAEESRERMQKARLKLSEILGCQPQQMIFTSGASESINTVLQNAVLSNKEDVRILITDGEHDAIRHTLEFWQKEFSIKFDSCPLNADGAVDQSALIDLLNTNTYDLFCFIHVSNLWGSINPVSEIVEICRRTQPRMKIHLDAVQSIGKVDFNFQKFDVDFATMSGHKIGAPKGIGLLLVKNTATLKPLIHGGGQQNNLRSGTENVAIVCILAHCLEKLMSDNSSEYVAELRCELLDELSKGGVKYTCLVSGVPNILSLIVHDLRAETIINLLSAKGIYVSAGSACNAKNGSNSALSKLIQVLPCRDTLPKDAEQKMLRISFNETNTLDEVRVLAQTIIEAVNKYGGH